MKPRKRFGQHFLKDPFYLQRFRMAIAPQADDHLVEIGAGQGALTDYLIGTTQCFDLIEIDRDLIPFLQKKYGHQATIHECDVLHFDFHQLYNDQKLRVVGNLPYNISTPLIFHLFEQLDIIQDMHFLLQKEVVDRLTAEPNTRHYGRLSIMTQFYCTAIALLIVPPAAFSPPPRVISAFVRLLPHKVPLVVKSKRIFQMIVRKAFNYRRKTLSNSLKRWITADQLIALDINPKKRPQELKVKEYIRISDGIE